MWAIIVILLITIAVDKTGFLLTDDLIELLYADDESKTENKKEQTDANSDEEPKKKVKVKSEKKERVNKNKDSDSDYLETDLPTLETSDSSVEEDAATMLEDIYK